MEEVKITEGFKEEEEMTEGVAEAATVRQLWQISGKVTQWSQDGEGEEAILREEEGLKTLKEVEEEDSRKAKEGKSSETVEAEEEEDLIIVQEMGEGDSITVKKLEEEDLRIVNVEKSIGLKWRHLMTTSVKQTKVEALILTGEDRKITGEDEGLA